MRRRIEDYGTMKKSVMDLTNLATEPLFLEDLRVGQTFTSGVFHMDEDRIKAFASEFDPQPFHLEESAAQASVFRGLAASGWHTAAVAMRLLVSGGVPFANGIVGLGGEIAWPNPTRPGDLLRLKSEILEILPWHWNSKQGVVRLKSTMSNQHGQPVYVFTAKILAFSRASQENPRAQARFAGA